MTTPRTTARQKPMATGAPTIVWLRQELRLDDHPALLAAAERGPVVPVYIWSPEEDAPWSPGGASRWWLHHSLAWLRERLTAVGSRLTLRVGRSVDELLAVAAECGADTIVATRRYEPFVHDASRVAELAQHGVRLEIVEGSLLMQPELLRTGSDRPYQVYTPFARTLRSMEPPPRPRIAPALTPPPIWPRSIPLETLRLLPTIEWAGEFNEHWSPGGEGAAEKLRRFLTGPVDCYERDRDVPSTDGTSGLSAHLHFGEISPRRVWYAVGDAIKRRDDATFMKAAEKFRAEVLWREFGHHILVHFPRTDLEPLRSEFARFPWDDNREALLAWQQGRTGYPLVDAGMRQLWRTGWMHNRVRMVVASFLVKHLLLPWQAGARWFWDTLVDADLANNSLGWQWSAGCGADAAPYFRIFNPVLQGEKFDPEGTYVRRFVPELARIPAKFLHRPWDAPAAVLAAGGVTLGIDYPHPIVEHGLARARALAALSKVSAARAEASDA